MGTAQAALFDRGSGLIYDDVLNITWLQDANYSKSNSFGTSGINSDGSMSWNTAQVWIGAMNSARHLGYSEWRLPKSLIDDPNCTTGLGGLSGYDMNCSGSELGYLYYKTLGRQGPYDQWGILHSGTENNNSGPFLNLYPVSYWTSTEWPNSEDTVYRFDFLAGGRDETWKEFSFPRAWAVLDGDVTQASAIPTPPVFILMLTALGLLGAIHTKYLKLLKRGTSGLKNSEIQSYIAQAWTPNQSPKIYSSEPATDRMKSKTLMGYSDGEILTWARSDFIRAFIAGAGEI